MVVESGIFRNNLDISKIIYNKIWWFKKCLLIYRRFNTKNYGNR